MSEHQTEQLRPRINQMNTTSQPENDATRSCAPVAGSDLPYRVRVWNSARGLTACWHWTVEDPRSGETLEHGREETEADAKREADMAAGSWAMLRAPRTISNAELCHLRVERTVAQSQVKCMESLVRRARAIFYGMGYREESAGACPVSTLLFEMGRALDDQNNQAES